MCIQFHVDHIYALDEQPKGIHHNGRSTFLVEDYPKDTIIAITTNGEIYKQERMVSGDERDPECWPPRDEEGIQLFRDYWRYICHIGETAPYFRAIIEAARTEIV